MQSTDNASDSKGLFALFKGESGSGKSKAALSFPTPFILDHDRKMPAIAKKHFPDRKFDWEVFEDSFQVSACLRWMKDYFPYLSVQDAINSGHSGVNEFPYETVIGDTLTSLSQGVLKTVDAVKGSSIESMIKNVKATSKGGKQVELRGYDYYNAEDMSLKEYIDELKFLWARPGNPRHVIVCAHILSHEDINKTQVRRLVTAGKAIGAYIPAQVDDMFHFLSEQEGIGPEAKPSRRIVYTDTVANNNAKTSYRLPIRLDITDEDLYDKISRFVNIGKGPGFVNDKAENYA